VRNIIAAAKTRPAILVDMNAGPASVDNVGVIGVVLLFGITMWSFSRYATNARRMS